MITHNLQESMLLWIPDNVECNLDWETSAKLVTLANSAVVDFCDREITFADMLDRVEFYNADMDNYLATLSENLRILGA